MQVLTETLAERLNNDGHLINPKNKIYKEISILIEDGVLIMQVAPVGKYLGLNGKMISLFLSTAGCQATFTLKNRREYFTAEKLAYFIGSFISNENVKKSIKSKYCITDKCFKCNGNGFLPQFKHVCNGVCFGCMGTGFKLTK